MQSGGSENSGCSILEELSLKTPSDLPPKQPCGRDSTILSNQHIATALKKGSHYFEWLNLRADTGETFSAEILLDSMNMDGKRVFQATIRDISERKKAEEQIGKMAHYDSLTGLSNRTLLNDRINRAISMANSLGMQVIAEAVETAEQLEFLRAKGCNEVQGYYFSKPLPVGQFEAFAREKSSFS